MKRWLLVSFAFGLILGNVIPLIIISLNGWVIDTCPTTTRRLIERWPSQSRHAFAIIVGARCGTNPISYYFISLSPSSNGNYAAQFNREPNDGSDGNIFTHASVSELDGIEWHPSIQAITSTSTNAVKFWVEEDAPEEYITNVPNGYRWFVEPKRSSKPAPEEKK